MAQSISYSVDPSVVSLAPAIDADFEFLYDLKKRAYKEYVQQIWGWDESFQRKFYQESFAEGNTKIIISGKQAVGSIDVKESETNIFISGLYLLPLQQSKGIGTKIIKDLIAEAKAKKKRLELEVLKVNSRAKKLYGKLGFNVEDRDENKYFMYMEPLKDNHSVEIIEYDQQYDLVFANLNRAWLEKYFVVEPIDEAIFADPKKYIIENGGFIFFATVQHQIAGTFALIKVEDGVFELSKMAVDERFQNRKIGNQMVEFSIKKARELKATSLILYSNTRLQPAIHLYKKFGFKEVPLGTVEYKRADIKMEIELK